jgi:hypothetical protein
MNPDDNFHLIIDVDSGPDCEWDMDSGVNFVVARVVPDNMVVRNLQVRIVLVRVMPYVSDLVDLGSDPGFVVDDHQRKKASW